MSDPTVRSECVDAACVITLDRPARRNAVTHAMLAAIAAAAEAAGADAAVAAVILHGGPSCFSSGADLTEARALGTAAETRDYFGEWHRLAGLLEALPKPVIAAIEGPCMTGGLELALACDLRIAGEGARFAITSARIGTVAGAGGTQRLPRLVGPARALEMLFSAEPIDAAAAGRIGLVNKVVPVGQALDHALELARLYAARAPLGLAYAKRAVREGMEMDLAPALALEADLVARIYASEDRVEGIAAFLEKRAPRFRGK